jgi:anti-sigma factor RsiW
MQQKRKFPDEEALQAYLQGRLDGPRRREIEVAAAQDPELSAWIDACAAQNRGMHMLYDSILREPIPEHLLRIFERN